MHADLDAEVQRVSSLSEQLKGAHVDTAVQLDAVHTQLSAERRFATHVS